MITVINPFQNIIAASMTGTSTVISKVTTVLYKVAITIQLIWTGTPTGTFFVEVSLDYNPGEGGAVITPGTWDALKVTDQSGSTPAAAGAAGSSLIEIPSTGSPYMRVRYVNSTGTGVLTGWISGKSLG